MTDLIDVPTGTMSKQKAIVVDTPEKESCTSFIEPKTFKITNPYHFNDGWATEPFYSLCSPGVTYIREQKKVHNNDQCPCGSEKKFKKCCK